MAKTENGIKMPDEVITDEETKEVETEEVKEEKTQAKKTTRTAKKAAKKFDPDELIMTRSITQGEMLLPGKKSGILYRWNGYGDETEVEYQDLYALKSSRSSYIYAPRFVIEDEELMADPRWKDVSELYDTMYDSRDINAILNLPPKEFEKVLQQIPSGFLRSVEIAAATKIDNGDFDSISKIKTLDRVCGTDFMSLLV